MKITLCQTDIVWGSPEANCEQLDRMLAGLGKTDLVLLPEMFSTGFATIPDGIAETSPAPTLEWMKRKASEADCAVAGSLSVKDSGKYYNRFYFVKPDGTAEFYDKRHLFTYGGEQLRYSAGKERKVVEWRGARFLLSVCYDLRFPCALRNIGDYDLLLCVASWPSERRYAWDTLLRARAIENQCYVAAVNRTGDDPICSYNGGSVLLDPRGGDIARCSDGNAEMLTAEADLNALRGFRESFPVLDDRDPVSL